MPLRLPDRRADSARRPLPAVVDTLESRRLCASTIEVTRTLVITGTDLNDTIFVDLDVGPFGGRTLRVTENGSVSGVFAEGEVVDILILCGDGDDTVRVGSGGFAGSVVTSAQIEGGSGNDSIEGGAGNDVIFGGAGDDFLTGYDGNDFVDAGAGNDVVIVHIGNDNVFGGPGDDQLNGKETGKNSSFDGGEGNDTITGTSRKDTITGGIGDDVIDGGRGADRVFGGDGADRITVTKRVARLFGDAGADTFLLGANNRARKAIKDFVDGEDSLQSAPAAAPIVPPSTAAPPTTSRALRDDLAGLLG
jgi:Ca2+-binding RTX toxin-like protein